MNRSAKIVRLLMRYGADARAGVHPNRAETTAHLMAIDRGFHDIAAIIEEEERNRKQTMTAAAGDSKPSAGATPAGKPVLDPQVRAAVERGDIRWLETRQVQQPIVNVIDWEEGGLLTVAAANDRLEVLAFRGSPHVHGQPFWIAMTLPSYEYNPGRIMLSMAS